ncbi:uncharacterized protein F4822DRAFT_396198 [Hypoxylon trugodes]|uniref:uncharacterized protein n=1 Tax=Hypoxylon trugodes TaxID=326681 RepID=UPI00219648FF|nr:uncharacterized protein F4822DRAFT_396198 [Hypoxylon trugodes]KAI1391277.1 hypothetical protein F4822DRAFT_396198 [Hypoxylon trugodes]
MQITSFYCFLLSAAVLGAPVKTNNESDAASTGAASNALTSGFGLDASTIDELTKTFPNEPNAEDCAGNLSFGQQRQCIDAGLLDDPSFKKRKAPSAEQCAGDNLSFGQQRQCIDAGLLDDPSFKKRKAPSAEQCAGNDLSFGQQRQCIDAGLLDDPSF